MLATINVTKLLLGLNYTGKAEKAMAPHSSTPAWKIPWMEEPGGVPPMGSHRVGYNSSDLAAAAALGEAEQGSCVF